MDLPIAKKFIEWITRKTKSHLIMKRNKEHAEYCKRDVELTRLLYCEWRKEK